MRICGGPSADRSTAHQVCVSDTSSGVQAWSSLGGHCAKPRDMREKGKTLPQTIGHVMCSHHTCLRGAVLMCAGAKLIGVVIGQFLEMCSNSGGYLRRLIGHLIGVLIGQVFGERS